MSKDTMKERGNAFEAHYFNKLSQEQAQALKEKMSNQQKLEDLQRETGITNQNLLQNLLEHDITAPQLTSLTLFPVAYTAWADGKLDTKEREAIKKACTDFGIRDDSPTMELMNAWLDSPVEEETFNLWSQWMLSILDHMDDEHATGFCLNIKNKAYTVAKASRSFLGFGAQISGDEAKALMKIETVLGISS